MTTPTGHRPEPPTERPEHGGDHRDGSFAAADLLHAALALASDLDLPTVLQRFVAASANLTGAAFAAINVLDARGRSTTFVQSGVDERLAKLIGRSPHAIGVLGTIPSHGTLRLDDLTSHPSFRGFPASHPPMGAFLGTLMPPDGRAHTVLRDGNGLVVDSLHRARAMRVDAMRQFGPALYAPMQAEGRGVGVLVLLRLVGSAPFGRSDLDTAESYAAQAALALMLAEARHAQDVAALLDERERIARDLHDLAIQQLFATGMQLETVRRRAARGVDPSELTGIVEDALDNVDSTVRQIRSIVHALRDPDAAAPLAERLRREASLARTGLGFAPGLVVTVDGRVLDSADSFEGDSGVEDDGAGLPADRDRKSGTDNLAARARRHGGTFSLGTTQEGRGTLLIWSAPMSRRARS